MDDLSDRSLELGQRLVSLDKYPNLVGGSRLNRRIQVSKHRIDTRGRFSGVSAIDKTVDAAQRWWPIMLGAYAALGTAYAKVSTLFPKFGWVDAVAIGFVGAMALTAATLWLFGAYRQWRIPPLAPRDRTEFQDEKVKLSDLIDGGAPLLSHKTFKRCIIQGPGQLKFLTKVEFLFCSIEERNLVTSPVGSNIMGAVMVAKCTFIECYFDAAIVGTPEDIDQARQAVEFETVADWNQKYA